MSDDHVGEARRAASKVRDWTARRDDAITEAVAAGASLRDLGDATGLSHTAVADIAKRTVVKRALPASP